MNADTLLRPHPWGVRSIAQSAHPPQPYATIQGLKPHQAGAPANAVLLNGLPQRDASYLIDGEGGGHLTVGELPGAGQAQR